MRKYYALLLVFSFLASLFFIPIIMAFLIPSSSNAIISYISLLSSYPISLLLINSTIKKSGLKDGIKAVTGAIDKKLFIIVFLFSTLIALISTLIDSSTVIRNREALPTILMSFIISIAFIPAQCFIEEFIFRILFQKAMLKDGFNSSLLSKLVVLIISSTFFSVLHLTNNEAALFNSTSLAFLYYFLSGAMLFALTYIERGYTSAIAYHSANNFFIAAIINRERGDATIPSSPFFISYGNFNAIYAILSIVASALLLASLIVIYQKAMYRREQIGKEKTGQKEEKEDS